MCKQNGYYTTAKKRFRKNKYKQVWHPTTCLCGAESPMFEELKRITGENAEERRRVALNSVIASAR